MTGLALLLVAAAALSHACWNFLTKRSPDKVVFLWWTGIAGSLIFLPVVLWLTPAGEWSSLRPLGVALAAVLRATYFASLGTAYTHGDLSLVYPLARGMAPVLVPPVAMIILGERPSLVGVLGIATVGLGVYVLHLPNLQWSALAAPFGWLASSHARYALLTGLMTAAYSLVDKWNMDAGAPPLLYAYLTIPVAALLLTPVALRRRSPAAAEWRAQGLTIPAVALLMTSGYLLVLLALQRAPVSYVAPARELGIVFGTVLGTAGLGERHGPPRTTGAILIVAGVLLLAV
jgi:drug/metabolite transporter (DMT)-like permease